jgi:hypothetical protein
MICVCSYIIGDKFYEVLKKIQYLSLIDYWILINVILW